MSALAPFRNEPVLELRRASEREALFSPLTELDAAGPVQAPVWIGAERREGHALVSHSPAEPERVVALAAIAGEDEVDAALHAAQAGARAWRGAPAAERAAVLVAAAAWMRERRRSLAALEVRECAKPWL
ncbi:MAG: L-glutamate gamma-semialdehyde dehydrogenase, partial [Pseudonocardiales bacterium]